MATVYDYSVKKANGEVISLRQYAGKPLIIVNTASKCGFTPQFKGLQELYEAYRPQGLEILGFPCDQFNNQEFDNIEETTEFCQLNYGVTFPVLAKIDVNGAAEDPLYTFLKGQKRGPLSRRIEWNFTKFLIDPNGRVVKRYLPTTAPDKLKRDLDKLMPQGTASR